MPTVGRFREGLKRMMVLDPPVIASLIIFILLAIIATVYISQRQSELSSSPPIPTAGTKEQFETAKLSAEIRQIRSDTTGSLFWLKMIAVLVTVGGAVGGYLVAQSRTTRQQLDFENRKNVDLVYQGIVQELSHESPVLRAAAAVKLGAILKSFPAEWTVNEARKEQIIQLTKQVLAAALSIEKDRKVLKTLTIALVLHKRWADDPNEARGEPPSLFAADIPFEFDVGKKSLPPGDYMVKAAKSNSHELTIIGCGPNEASLVMRAMKASKDPEKPRLVFHRYDKRY